jgi:hypothetical protein
MPIRFISVATCRRPTEKLIPPGLDHIRVDIELRGQLGQRLLALHSSKCHLRLEDRAVVPAWSSRHGVSCSRHHAAVRQKIHLSQLFRLTGPALIFDHDSSAKVDPI